MNMTCFILVLHWANEKEIGEINIVCIICVYNLLHSLISRIGQLTYTTSSTWQLNLNKHFDRNWVTCNKGPCKRYYGKRWYKTRIRTKRGFTKAELRLTLCLASQHVPHVPSAQHDSNSNQIAIDSCCSFSIAKHRGDFIGELVPCTVK